VQSAAGKESTNRTALNRCTNIEARWNIKLASLASPEMAKILLPSSFKRRRAEELLLLLLLFELMYTGTFYPSDRYPC